MRGARARGEAKRILIVTPASLKHQWAREIATFTSEKAVVVGGGNWHVSPPFQSDAPYKILNYELTWRELTRLQSLDADVLVLDEAQRAKLQDQDSIDIEVDPIEVSVRSHRARLSRTDSTISTHFFSSSTRR
ncbi:MAG: SNF2-related protein [Polyangiaceae bacterium]